jgi:hypothetical protein
VEDESGGFYTRRPRPGNGRETGGEELYGELIALIRARSIEMLRATSQDAGNLRRSADSLLLLAIAAEQRMSPRKRRELGEFGGGPGTVRGSDRAG